MSYAIVDEHGLIVGKSTDVPVICDLQAGQRISFQRYIQGCKPVEPVLRYAEPGVEGYAYRTGTKGEYHVEIVADNQDLLQKAKLELFTQLQMADISPRLLFLPKLRSRLERLKFLRDWLLKGG